MTKTAWRSLSVVFLIHEITSKASGTRNGGSMRMADFFPTMREVTLKRPLSEDDLV